jgi:Carbohydrate-selective porin, OprB family
MRQKLPLLSLSLPSVKTAVFSVLWMTFIAIQLTNLPASQALTSITNLAVSDSGTELRAVSAMPSVSEVPTSLVAVASTPPARTKLDAIEGNHLGKKSMAATKANTAVALSATLRQLEDQITVLEQDEEANAEVLSALRDSYKRLQNELVTLTIRLDAIEITANEHNRRLSALEKVQIHGDATFGTLSDFSRGSGSKSGIENATSSVGRLRLTIDAPVYESKGEDDKLGNGTISARIIGAFGRYGPSAAANSNTYGSAYAFNAYSRIASDISAFNEGFGTGAVGSGTGKLNGQNGFTSATRPNIFLESLFYKQNIKAGVPFVTELPSFGKKRKASAPDKQRSADVYAGIVRWWDLFDVSPYRGDEQSQFQNNAFINTPGIAVNYAMPMAGYVLHQGLGKSASMDFSTAIGSVDVGDFADTLNVTYEEKVFYKPAFLPEKFQKPGSVYAGGYNVTMSGNRNFNKLLASSYSFDPTYAKDSLNGVYLGWNQEWWKGIGTTVNYLLNSDSPTAVLLTSQQPGPAGAAIGARNAFSAVFSIPMSALGATKRVNDTIGLGYAGVNIQNGFQGPSTTYEHVVETYYRFKINDSFSVIPSVQWILNPIGSLANAPITVLGLRASYRF